MGVAGSNIPPGGAPKPDPERVATLRYTLVDEPETCAAFGESAHATLAALNDRALAETRSGDLGECGLLLDHVRDRVAGLDPARLEPRGLFDSRGRRLKGFRAAYVAAADAVAQSAADLGDRAGALARKGTALETLWAETRDAIAELDAHIAAARGWLANEAPPAAEPVEAVVAPVEAAAPEPAEEDHERCEAQADAEAEHHAVAMEAPAEPEPVEAVVEPTPEATEDVVVAEPEAPTSGDAAGPVEADPVVAEAASEEIPEPETAPEPAPVAALPHPLETRLAALEAVRATAIGRLPLLRAAQNADCRAPDALKQVCDGVEAWRADWRDALGLAGKRPKKVKPDRMRLLDASTALTDRIDAASRDLSAAQSRRAELDARAAAPAAAAALAA